jgi:UDPglucose 6-dehydrogenase
MLFPVNTVGIVGNGVVGSAIAHTYMSQCQVCVYDKEPIKTTNSLRFVLECDVIFLCLPTPQKRDSLELDVSAIYDFLWEAKYIVDSTEKFLNLPLVIKSTVPIGFTQKIHEEYQLRNIVHSPEFLTARCAYVDARLPSRNIIGTVKGGSADLPYKLRDLYEARFPGIANKFMSSDESEAVKLMTNGFFATKITFFNEMYRLCEGLNLDWETVLAGILGDGRISHSHTQVPGPDGQFGFGGKCLPKDLAQLIHHVVKFNGADSLVVGALRYNEGERV